MAERAGVGDAGEAITVSLGAPAGGGIGVNPTVVRRVSKRRRGPTNTGDIEIGGPVEFTGKSSRQKDVTMEAILTAVETLVEAHRRSETQMATMHQEHQREMQAVLQEVKEAKAVIKQLEDEVKAVTDTVNTVRDAVSAITASSSRPTLSWAQMASSGVQSSQPSFRRSERTERLSDSTGQASSQRLNLNEGRTIQIDTTRAKGDTTDINKVRDQLTKAIQHNNGTEDVAIEHIRVLFKNRLEICLREVEQCQNARKHPRWLEIALPGARMRGETWYPIKCDGVAKTMVLNPEGDGKTFKADVLDNFARENSKEGIDCTARKIVWLSKPSDKPTGSLGIWLAKREAASYMLNTQTVMFGASVAYAAPFKKRENLDPCYNCNSYGHFQSRCTKATRCGICAQGHQTRDCMNHSNPRCPACGGPHTVMDKGCPANPRKQRTQGQDGQSDRGNPLSPSQC